MRKSVVFLISVIYIISIVVVTFFGLRVNMDQFNVYMNRLEITSYERIVNDEKYAFLEFDDNDANNNIIFIDWQTGPDNATNPDAIRFSLVNATYTDSEGNVTVYAEIHGNGELVFYARRTVKVTITATDGSNLSDSITIRCYWCCYKFGWFCCNM